MVHRPMTSITDAILIEHADVHGFKCGMDFLCQHFWRIGQVANAVDEHTLIDSNGATNGIALHNSP